LFKNKNVVKITCKIEFNQNKLIITLSVASNPLKLPPGIEETLAYVSLGHTTQNQEADRSDFLDLSFCSLAKPEHLVHQVSLPEFPNNT
jgi:hypothetical protein